MMEAPVGLEAGSVEVERVAAGWEVARAVARAAAEATEASSAVEVTAEARVEAVGSPAMAAGVVERGQMRSEVPTRHRRWRRAGPVG